MRRLLFIFMPLAIVAAIAWYLFSPLLFDDVVSEQLATSSAVVATGSLRDADSVHKGQGDVAVVQTDAGLEIQFTGFQVTNGPDLEVWLSAHPDPQTSSDVKGAAFLSLGQLKGNIGDQAYTLPAGTNIATYGSVVIWCQQFGVLFAPAALMPAS